MSLLLLAAASGGAAGSYAVAYGGDAATLYDPADLTRGGVTTLPQTVSADYGGDAATLYDPDAALAAEPNLQAVAYGGDASSRYPVTLFVTVNGQTIPAGSDPENRVRVWHFADAASLAANTGTELDNSFGRGWVNVLSEAGSFAVSLQNTDADLAAINYGDYIRCDLDGIAAFVGIVESIDRVTIAQDEEHGQVTKLRGRGAVAEWEHASVNPSTPAGSKLFHDTRHFGWMSVELLDQAWQSGRRQWRQDTLAAGYGAKWGTPLGWPDRNAYWIWSKSVATTPPLHDPGISYFRNGFTLAAAADVAVYLAADDAFEAWVDGVPIGGNGQVNGWKEPFRADISLDAGQHIIAIKAENYDRLVSTNTAGLIVAVYTLDDEGNDDTLLLRTGGADWEVQHYPETPPGFTVGQVIRLLLEEAQADGILTGWSVSFDDANGSDGNPWPTSQQFSFPVGVDGGLLAVLAQLAETHIDYTFDTSDRILHAWRIGEAGSATAVGALTSGLGSLTFEGRG